MSESLLIAIFGILSAGVGAVVHALFQRWQLAGDQLRHQKVQTYSDYFSAVGQLSHALDSTETARAHAKIAEARGRIAIYGSPEVIETMTLAFRCGPIQNADLATHVNMMRAIRRDVGLARGDPSDQALFEILFGEKPR